MSVVLCLGILAATCQTPATEIPLAAGSQALSHTLSVVAPGERK